jgi:hypothetical protein
MEASTWTRERSGISFWLWSSLRSWSLWRASYGSGIACAGFVGRSWRSLNATGPLLICLLRGHNGMLRVEPGAVYLKCERCGRRSVGIQTQPPKKKARC